MATPEVGFRYAGVPRKLFREVVARLLGRKLMSRACVIRLHVRSQIYASLPPQKTKKPLLQGLS